ncbi:hypothetical protein AVDCRST_MAG94-3656 [uncultured Leptolyngbya sp.]|uniref:Uncharacterized protein n=1 Tax=uncultured Leptolyngbya sp. TaxID=332963 RepID=A0A6J4MP98_9CYAN|nr:hypothetical protein AVDCRST_MAG94-3656 [uncultured Leptolyngbya sp.]
MLQAIVSAGGGGSDASSAVGSMAAEGSDKGRLCKTSMLMVLKSQVDAPSSVACPSKTRTL